MTANPSDSLQPPQGYRADVRGAAIRLALVLRGGQYFDWDEPRYGFARRLVAAVEIFREIVGEVVRKYGSSNVQLDTTILHTIDATGPKFLPIESARPESSSTPKRYVLLNASDIWIEGDLGMKPPPRGKVLLTARHPRQFRAMQYHGYTPEQRTFLRSVDFSIRLIDTEE